MATKTVTDLRDRVQGPVIGPDDEGYDEHRNTYQAMYDRRPAVIVRAEGAADVVAALDHARENGLDLAVRGGGHSVPAYGSCDGGVAIDLSLMRNVEVDPANQIARTQGGCTWGDHNDATHAHGLASTGGIISTTGVGGLTLGGGIGYLARGLGLSLDCLVGAEVVTADGRIVRADAGENADLFWALRGGGGNFGVVTTFEIALSPVHTIYGGPMLYELDDAATVMRFYNEYIRTAPEEMGAFFAYQIAPPLDFIPAERHGDTFCLMVVCWAGPVEEGEKQLMPFFDVAPVVAHHTGPAPYPALNSAFDALVPPGLQHYWKAHFSTELTDGAIAAHGQWGPKMPAVNSTMHVYSINGACHRVGPEETAWGHRDATFATVIAGMWPDPADNDANIAWVRGYYDETVAHSQLGGYINFMSEDDESNASANFGANYERLAQVKRDWDPDNLFHLNQNIRPS